MPKNRKDEHVALAESFYQEKKTSDFDSMQFVHHSLPEVNIDDISLSTSFSTLNMGNPFYINAMTGGSEKTKNINAILSEIAKETDIAIASGSQSAALNDPHLKESFTVLRKNNPKGIIFANLGAERSLEDAKSAIDMIEANALQLHINVPQELMMPEGSRQFSNWLSNIEKITSNVGVPVIAKEVGFGMSSKTIQKLMELGVHTIDVGGNGGTNFIQIENARRQNEDYSYLMDWGQSTPISLLEAYKYSDKVNILGSGGIRNPLDIIKALSLRARAVGIAGIILHHLNAHGPESTVNFITDWKEQLKVIMCLLGTTSIQSLDSTDVVLSNSLVNWCEARNISWKHLSNRQN